MVKFLDQLQWELSRSLGISEAIITGVSNEQGFFQAAYYMCVTNTAIVLTWIYMAHAVAFATIRMAKTREHLREVLTQRNCEHCTYSNNTIIVLRVPSTIAGIWLECWRDRPFLDRTRLVFDEVVPMGGKRQHDRTPTKFASALESFPVTVITPSAWPDWSKFQFSRSWCDPAETTTYRTRSERSTH